MLNNPKVSIIIPVYNGSNFLKKAIDCALSQTYENIEIIVVNDGSSDDGKTEEIAMSYGKRIQYLSKPNGGVSSALNVGIANMTGEYFSWLSHDDEYTNDKVKNSIDLLKAHNMLGKKCVAYTSGYFIDVHGNQIKNFKEYFSSNKVYSGREVVDIMTKKGTLNGCCMLIPKSTFSVVGGFDETLRYSQDSLMWYKISLAGYSWVSDNLPNVMNRVHKNQVTNLRKDLFEHDSLIIAELLAEPLVQIDSSGKLLKQYVKRLTRYQCDKAICYLCNYASDKGCLSQKEYTFIRLYKIWGGFRYRITSSLKKCLINIRH